MKFTDYTRDKVCTLYTSADELRRRWSDPDQRKLILEQLEERGINLDELAAAADQPDADAFDLLCHIAFNAPLRTRRERAPVGHDVAQDRQDGALQRLGGEPRHRPRCSGVATGSLAASAA